LARTGQHIAIRNLEDGKDGQVNFIEVPEAVIGINALSIDPTYKHLLVVTTNHPNKDLHFYNYDLRNSSAAKLIYSQNLT